MVFRVEMNLLVERSQWVGDDARRFGRGIWLRCSDVFLRGRGYQLGMLEWALVEKRGRKAPRRSRSAVDGYDGNLLLICRGVETKLFLFLGSLESGEGAGSVWLHRRAAAGNKTAAQPS